MRFKEIPKERWPAQPAHFRSERLRVLVSDLYLVQVFREKGKDALRMTVNCIKRRCGDWRDGITWDTLQEIKDSVGYAECDAIEIYPRQADIVNLGNLRHLWILPELHPLRWKQGD